jgi:hypothetical protein
VFDEDLTFDVDDGDGVAVDFGEDLLQAYCPPTRSVTLAR